MSNVLKPLDLSQVGKKNKKNGKLAKRLEKIRQTSGATKLQSIFRGHKARPALAEIVATQFKKIKNDIVSSNKELESFNDIPFSEVKSVQCCVDAAEGLPRCCTATRVTVRLLTETRQQIGDVATSICNLESDPHCPTYTDCIGSWDKSMLSASTYTFLIRLDTLERPSLNSSVVGYSVIKLCTDEYGKQPTSTTYSSNLYNTDDSKDNADATTTASHPVLLNSGLFRIPVYYGSLISDPHSKAIFNEFNTSIQLTGKLPDTYIYIRIFDSTIDKPSRFSFIKKNSSTEINSLDGVSTQIPIPMQMSTPTPICTKPKAMAKKHYKEIDSKWDCVILLVLSAQFASNPRCGWTVFPGVRNQTLYDRYVTGYGSGPDNSAGPSPVTVRVTPDEVVVILKQMMEWVRTVFTPYSNISRLIDLKYAYCYKDTEGFCVSVDGLYNMTDAINYNIVESSVLKNRSAVSNGEIKASLVNAKGTSKRDLGAHTANIKKLSSTYKISLRYLRGAYTPFDMSKGVPSGPDSSCNPSTMNLNQSLDPSGESGAMSTPQKPKSPQRNSSSPALQRTSPSSSRSTSPVHFSATPNCTANNGNKTDSIPIPIHHPDDIIDDVSTVLDFHTSKEAFPLYYDTPKIVSDMQLGMDACVLIIVTLIKLQVSESGKIFVSMQYGSDSPAACNYYGLCPVYTLEPSPYFMDTHTPNRFLEEKSDFNNCYVNTGTFQIPLFMGTVPTQVLESDTPYQTLCKMISKQNMRDAKTHAMLLEENRSNTWLGSLLKKMKVKATARRIVPEGSEGPEVSEISIVDLKDSNFEQVKLTSGASVLLRMSDARMYPFNHSHIGHDFSITPDTSFIKDIIRYYSTYYGSYVSITKRKNIDMELNNLFKYDSMKFDDEMDLKKNLPPSVVSGRSLWRKATDIYTKNVLEFHENS